MVHTRMERIENLEQCIEEIRQENRQQLNDAMAELRTLIQQNNNNRREDVDSAALILERERRLEVPYFSDDDPYGWIYRAERYFEINRIPDEEKVCAASICFEKKALN